MYKNLLNVLFKKNMSLYPKKQHSGNNAVVLIVDLDAKYGINQTIQIKMIGVCL